jgi:predicted amidophosphoribosyltransferase
VRDDLLARARETATQTALTPAARLANVAGAFETGNAEVGTRNELVLVDDVFTTGATLAEAARALETAGAEAGSVTAVTFGRALIPDFT